MRGYLVESLHKALDVIAMYEYALALPAAGGVVSRYLGDGEVLLTLGVFFDVKVVHAGTRAYFDAFVVFHTDDVLMMWRLRRERPRNR